MLWEGQRRALGRPFRYEGRGRKLEVIKGQIMEMKESSALWPTFPGETPEGIPEDAKRCIKTLANCFLDLCSVLHETGVIEYDGKPVNDKDF